MKEPITQPKEQTPEEVAGGIGFSKIITPSARDAFRKNPDELNRWFINQIHTFAEDAKRRRTFILHLETFEWLMERYGSFGAPSLPEVIRVCRAMVYEGKGPEASGCRVSMAMLKKWTRYMGMEFDKYEGMDHYRSMNLNTIWHTGILHQFACEAGVDLKDFPIKIL